MQGRWKLFFVPSRLRRRGVGDRVPALRVEIICPGKPPRACLFNFQGSRVHDVLKWQARISATAASLPGSSEKII